MAHILVVEDNQDILSIISRILRIAGYTVLKANDGIEAIEMARRHYPDLILMDLVLPALDGWLTTRQLKSDQRTAHIPVVAVTACASVEDEQHAREAGCDAFIMKPFDANTLLLHIDNLLNVRPGRGGIEQSV
ncbi:MAG: response regulator [Chloroflexales bacterium]|nr:response regulator [Chloroflexales bacterium]